GLYRLLSPTDNPNIKDTVNFLVTNSSSDVGAGGPSVVQDTFRINVSRNRHLNDTPVKIGSDTVYYSFMTIGQHSSSAMFCVDVISDSLNVVIANHTSTQPFLNVAG